MTINLDVKALRAKFDNHEMIFPEEIADLLTRLEQAEQAVVLANAECTRQKQQKGILFRRTTEAEQAVQRVREVIRQYDPDHLTCMCNSDGDCCKCTVADFQEALDGDTRRCAECDGTGDVQVRFAHGVQTQDCASCFGSGETK